MARPKIIGEKLSRKQEIYAERREAVVDDDLRVLSLDEVAAVLNIAPDTLRDMDDPPPFIWLSANRRGCPRFALRQWQERRLTAQANARKRKAAQPDQSKEVAA